MISAVVLSPPIRWFPWTREKANAAPKWLGPSDCHFDAGPISGLFAFLRIWFYLAFGVHLDHLSCLSRHEAIGDKRHGSSGSFFAVNVKPAGRVVIGLFVFGQHDAETRK